MKRKIQKMFLIVFMMLIFCIPAVRAEAASNRSLCVAPSFVGKEKIGKWYFEQKFENGSWKLRFGKTKSAKGKVIIADYSGAVTDGTDVYYGVHRGSRYGKGSKLDIYKYHLSSGKRKKVLTIPYALSLEGVYNHLYYVNVWGEYGWGASYVYNPRTKKLKKIEDSIIRGSYGKYMIISTAGDTLSAKPLLAYNAGTKKIKTISEGIHPDACYITGHYVYYIEQKYNQKEQKEYLKFYRYDITSGTRKALSSRKIHYTYSGYITEWTKKYACYRDESGNTWKITFK